MCKHTIVYGLCIALMALSGCQRREDSQASMARTEEPRLAESLPETRAETQSQESVAERSQLPEHPTAQTSPAVSGQPAPLGRDDYGQDLEISYDGIPMGCDFADIVGRLDKLPSIQRTRDGLPFFERVPTKTYYRYYVDRLIDREKDQSEVALFFKDGKLIQMKDVFGGFYTTAAETRRRFESLRAILEAMWGTTEYRANDRVTWVRGSVTAVLRMELPTDSIALPIITLLIWTP